MDSMIQAVLQATFVSKCVLALLLVHVCGKLGLYVQQMAVAAHCPAADAGGAGGV